jgi:acetyl-CoA acetyltransferase
MAAASILSGIRDLVIAGGTEMMSMEGRRGDGPLMMDAGNLHLRALPSAVTSGRLRECHRHHGRHHPRRRRCGIAPATIIERV